MSKTEYLKSDQADAFLILSVHEKLCGTLSCLRSGKWFLCDVVVCEGGDTGLHVRIVSDEHQDFDLKKNQPVGICLQHERHNYIFETSLAGRRRRISVGN